MTFSLTWLPKVLRDAGLKVEEVNGWQTRGLGDVGQIKGVLCHHTAGSKQGNAGSLDIVTNGRPDLRGPLSQLVLGRDGIFYVVAAGRSNHAGTGNWPGVGINGGNRHLIGIEAENTGLENDNPWPAVQMDAYAKGCAAILNRIGAPAAMCLGHLEYAPNRKSDPSFSVGNRQERLKAMEAFRARVAQLMASPGVAAPRDDTSQPVHRPTLRRGSSGEDVKTLQKALGFTSAAIDGDFSAKTEAAVKQKQQAAHIVADGIVGAQTWALLT